MAAKKKTAKRPPKTPRKVPGTPRTHRMVDAEELRDNVKQRTPGKVKK
jgi:hypothetical protein